MNEGVQGFSRTLSVHEVAKTQETKTFLIPAEVPRQARDPELVERAGIQEIRTLLDSGLRRGDGLEDVFRYSHSIEGEILSVKERLDHA